MSALGLITLIYGEAMEYITLRNSDLNVSRVCMGGCPLGGYGWGSVSENDLIEAVRAALASGINFFDTAETYGLGQSELTLGRALGADRKRAVICDKFGVHAKKGQPTFYDNSREYIISACEGSLKRLGTDYIDIYTIHYRDGKTPLGEVVDTLRYLRSQGKIRYFGLSNIHSEDREELSDFRDEFVSFQDEYSLACRKNEEDIFYYSKEYGLTPLTWGSLGQGILTGKYSLDNVSFAEDDRRSRDIYVNFHGEKLRKNLEIADALKRIAAEYDKTAAAAAVRFILDYIDGSCVLTGAKNARQIISNAQAADWSLSQEHMDELCKISQD